MKFYADLPARRTRQVLADLAAAAWVYLSVRAALWLHDLVMALAAPGRKAQAAGDGLAGNLADAAGGARKVPLVGDKLAIPFDQAASAARDLAQAGRDVQDTVARVALWSAVAAAAVPVMFLLVIWLPRRLRWMRRATAAAALRTDDAGLDLLALRALANRPLKRLRAADPDPVDAWRRADPDAVRALAALELRELGLRPR